MATIPRFTNQLFPEYTDERPSPSVSSFSPTSGNTPPPTPTVSPELNEIEELDKLEKLKAQIKSLKPFSGCRDEQIGFIAKKTLKSPNGFGKFNNGILERGFAVEIDPQSGDLRQVYLKERYIANGFVKITYAASTAVSEGSQSVVYQTFSNKPDPEAFDRRTAKEAEKLFQQVSEETKIQERLDHPNIVKIKSFEFVNRNNERKIGIIAERMDTDLQNKLLSQRPETQLTFNEKVQIALDTATAVDYVHGQNLAHNDLKPNNILLKEKLAKLSDFGIACAIGETPSGIYPKIDPPEIQSFPARSAKTDVYQFGLLLWHLFKPVTTSQEFADDYQYPSIEKMFEDWGNSELFKTVRSLICSCLSSDPAKRPSFQDVMQTLQALKS